MQGSLYLVPNLLGTVPPHAVLPARTIEVARGLHHWIVETPKPARAFLGTLDPTRPIAALSIRALGEAPDAGTLATLLAPAGEGHDIGLMSDAGCPAVADPGARVVAAAHAAGIRVVPLVGPSSLLLALMASGMNGQRFAFHGYLPADEAGRVQALRRLEAESRAQRCTQIFIETPYRNGAMLAACTKALQPATRLCVAVDLTLRTESVVSQSVQAWRGLDSTAYHKRPAIFLLLASA
jgi:16S rRNA (cytidine1402-2'-O)-methyltransferase